MFVASVFFGAQAANMFVRPDGSDSNVGTSWSAAKLTVKKALATAGVGDTVFVAQGSYPASITLVDGKHIFGSYNPASGEQDIDRYPTIIEGETVGNRLVAASKAFVNPTVIDGLVLQNATHGHSGGGAAIYENITLRNCIIRSCTTTASSGGGVYMHSNSALQNCIIELCSALKEGGAVYVSSGCTVTDCIIRGCSGKYGAVYNNGGTLSRCLIHNCEPSESSWPGTGGIYNPKGQVSHCTVCNNLSDGGYAGIHSVAKVINSVFWNNQTVDDFGDPVNFISASSNSAGNMADEGFDGVSFSSISLNRNNNATGGPHFRMPVSFVGLPKDAGQIAAMRAADYTLTTGSPLIISGNTPDVGAYEFDPDAPVVNVTDVVMLTGQVDVYVGQVSGAGVVVYPKNATDKRLTWSVDDPAIATVDSNGAVTGVSLGTTILHVTTVDGGYTATATVVVSPLPPSHYPAEVDAADTLYRQEDYTVPSFIPFLVAKQAAHLDTTKVPQADVTAAVQAMRDAIAALQSKENPYNMIANINGDPMTHMAFCWFTNEGITDGEVQLLPMEDAVASDFESGIGVLTLSATSTTTKPLRYAVSRSGIIDATGLPANTKFTYVSHKALATNLIPGTTYSWRVGYEGHWSPIAHFRTEDAGQGEYSFVYMSDSHIQDQEYIDHARWCATAVANTVPEARFCVFPGDFVETGTSANSEWEWERWFEEALRPVIMRMPVVVTDGNHDDSDNLNYTYHFNTDNTFNLNAIVKPQFDGITYSFVYGDVLFLVYSKQDYWRGPYDYNAQTSAYLTNDVGNWFKEQVAMHPDTKYRVGLVHKGVFCGAGHCKDTEGPTFRTTMLPIMKECEIDLLLQGHDHCYEVIGPVNPDTRTPILTAVADREPVEVNSKVSISGYRGGTYTVDEGTLYFIGATCGRKRYSPYDRAKLDSYKSTHKMNNYFDLFTGMFAQPEAPSFTKITVTPSALLFNSYTADQNGNATLINTMQVKRTRPHTLPTGYEDVRSDYVNDAAGPTKFIRNGQMFIRKDGHTWNMLGQIVQ